MREDVIMEGRLLKIPNVSGFQVLPMKRAGSILTAFISKFAATGEYEVGELTTLNGLCKYHFLQASGLIVGFIAISPAVHTIVTHMTLKIGSCSGGNFRLSHDLQPQGVLIYENDDSGLLMIPVNVDSPLLVGVDL
jgi:hypothetical protein